MRYRPIILIADHSRTFMMYFTILLGRMGFDIIPVSNGKDAMNLSKVFNPDLIIIETELPKMDGITTLKHIKDDEEISNVPVIMISTDAGKIKQKASFEAGAAGYITKPLNILELHKAIQNCIVYSKGHKRSFLRTSCNQRVDLSHDGISRQAVAITLSEGGVYIKDHTPLPEKTPVKVTLPLANKTKISLSGSVIYSKSIYREGLIKTIPGMAIKFTRVSQKQTLALRAHILNQLLEDIINETGDIVIKPENMT